LASGASTFFPILPIKNQVGIAFYTAGVSAGLEIAGGGISYAPAGPTLVNGVTTTFNMMNANGSSIGLKANGSGFPICREAGIWPPSGYLPGAPALWLSAGNSFVLSVLYFTNEAMPNQ
jgi:hypothetical protein